MAATASKKKKKAASDEVTITLAHPLRAVYAVRLGLDDQDYPTESKVKVRRDVARSIINAGYAADIDPEDPEAVADALGTTPPANASPAAAGAASKK